MLQRSTNVLRDFDDDAGTEVEAAFRDEGIAVHTGCTLTDARAEADKVIVYEQARKTCELRAEAVSTGWAARRTPGRSTQERRRRDQAGPHRQQCANADECVAYFRRGRLHRAARDRALGRAAGGRRAQHAARQLTAVDGLPPAHQRGVHRSAGGSRWPDGKSGEGAGHPVSHRKLPVQRPRQIDHHGGDARFCETALRSQVRAKFLQGPALVRWAAN